MSDRSLLEAGLEKTLKPLLRSFTGKASVALYRFSDGFRFGISETEKMPAASLIKIPILIEALIQSAKGKFDIDGWLELQQDDIVSGAGILQYLTAGLQPTLRDLLTLMIIVSDNTATNMVIDVVGLEAVNKRCGLIGLGRTKLVGKLQLPVHKQNDAQRKGESNVTCAADMLDLLVALQKGLLLSHDLSHTALSMLKKQQFTEALARYLPTDAELHDKAVSVASKSGCLRGVWHDAGIIYDYAQRPSYSLVVMTEDAQDRSFGWEQEGMMLIANVAKEVHKFLEKVQNTQLA